VAPKRQKRARREKPEREKQHLTDADVRRLPAPASGKAIHLDDDVTGFGVRVTAAGARSYVLRYTTRVGRERTYTIGQTETWRCTEARAEARRLRQVVDQGGDPMADIEEERAAPTVGELCDRFEQEHVVRKRESTARDYRAILNNHIRAHFGPHARVADVAFADCDALHRKITKSGATYVANRTIAVLSKMFSLAIKWGYRESNPTKGIERNTEHLRRRYLKGDELARLTAALAQHPDQQAADAVRLCLFTGARRMETLSARWADVDLGEGVWSKPPSSTKQKQHHQVPLSAPARALLARIREQQQSADRRRLLPEYVFPGTGARGHRVELKKDWRQLCKAARIDGLRLHDLRHSFASQLASGGASLPLIGALLGHSNPSTTHRYAHLFSDPQREAVERVGAAIESAGKPAAPVVPLKGRGRP
jgi:integrase